VNDVGDFIGRGWSFPVQLNARGGILLATGADEINASLRMILGTAPGERVMRPTFGCRIWDLLYQSIDANTIGQIETATREAIQQWEPRIDLVEVNAVPDTEHDGLVNVEVTYLMRPTNDRRNLVYPFYVIPREGDE
jgi:phage baseplate assembly protein W